MIIPRSQATRLVGALGWMVGLVSLLLGVSLIRRFGLPFAASLMLVGLTAVLGTSAEDFVERQLAALREISARAAVRQPTWILAPDDQLTPELATALALLGQPMLPVVDQARLVGLVTEHELSAARAGAEPKRVAQVMRTAFAHVPADADLWQAQQILAGTGSDTIPVLDGEQLLGLLTSAGIRAATLEPPSMLRIERPQLIPASEPSL
jgi:CBS-domain-containing membrane protein